MKTTRPQRFTALATTAIILASTPLAFAQDNSTSYDTGAYFGQPKTAPEKLQSLKTHHQEAFSELSAVLNRLPVEPDFLGTKELFSEIDKSGRTMKNIRSGCTTLMTSLRADVKAFTESPSFTEEEKQELKLAADSLEEGCATLSKTLDVAIDRLDAAYTILPRWNKTYKAYLNLQAPPRQPGRSARTLGNI